MAQLSLEPAGSKRSNDGPAHKTALTAGAMGIQFGVSIVIGALLGSWADRHFGWNSWGLIGGVVIGSIAAFRDLARFARQANPDSL